MTDEEYIATTNLCKIRSAQHLLGSIKLEDSELRVRWRESLTVLDELEQYFTKEVEE